MGRAEFTVNVSALEQLAGRFKSPELEAKLQGVAAQKEVAAMVAQAIADNFDKEGPGWAPLKGATIRNSVGLNMATKALLRDAYLHGARKMGAIKTVKKGKNKGKQSVDYRDIKGNRAEFYGHVDKYIERVEAGARRSAAQDDPLGKEVLGNRSILRRTGLLYKTVTTPGFSGSAKRTKYGGVVTGANIYRVQGSNLVWGTNLIYAATHNYGAPERGIPQREFLKVREQWMARLTRFVFKLMADVIKNHIEGK